MFLSVSLRYFSRKVRLHSDVLEHLIIIMKKHRSFFHPVKILLFLILLCAFRIQPSVSAPLIKDPAFIQLGTAQGLAQETVRDIVRDQDGFIWIATEGGLSRWDGYRFINLEGPDGIFTNNVISNLFADSSNRLWLSSSEEGIYYVDLATGKYQLVVKQPLSIEPEWLQEANGFEELDNNDMAIALDEVVIRYSHKSGQKTELFRLSQEELDSGNSIRDIKHSNDQLFIATSSSLYVLSLKDNGQTVKTLRYLTAENDNPGTRNAKSLYLYSPSLLLVGTVGGLFSVSLDDFIARDEAVIDVNTQYIVENRNIWTMAAGTRGEIWLGTERGLHRLVRQETGWQSTHILNPSSGLIELADKAIHSILPDAVGNLWLGSKYGGLLFWYAKPLSIETYQNTAREPASLLANNMVWSFLQQGDDLWVGTENGMTRFNLSDKTSQHYFHTDEDEVPFNPISVEVIYQGADENSLILESGGTLKLFSIQTGELSEMPQDTPLKEKVFSDWIYGSGQDEQGRIYFLAHDFYRYDPKTGELELLPFKEAGLNPLAGGNFLDAHPYYPGKVFLCLRSGLYMIDINTLSVTEVMMFPESMQKSQNIVTSFTVDAQQNLWLGFPNRGIIGLDANTFAKHKTLSADDLLYSDIVYNLTSDKEGNIWFSSHGYFARYQPLSDSVQTYRYGEEIRVSEFNAGAAVTLDDGRIVLGSTSGFIVFDPVRLSKETASRKQNIAKMVISGVSLDSRPIVRPPHDLSGEHVDLNHDDFGITIQFSGLSSSYDSETAFRYKLVRDNTVVNESVTKNGSINFAFLSPGEYHFDVSPLKQSADTLLLPASLSFTIPYPPLRSPVAYGIYSCVFIALLGFYLFHRQRQLKRLHDAQHQVRLFGDAFQHTRDWVMIFDSAFVPVAVNPSCCAAFGIDSDKPLERQLTRMFENSPRLGAKLREKVTSLNAGEFWKSEERLTGVDGRHYDVLIEVSVTGIQGEAAGRIDHYLIIMSDISEQKNAERKLIKVANYDSLTGLANRSLLLEKLEIAIEKAGQKNEQVGVLFVDLDRFKGINDSLGHDYGDKLLRVVANRMLNLASEDDLVARLGGDEFVIVMEDVANKNAVGQLVDQLIESVETPIALGSEVVRVSASVGIAFYPDDAVEPAELLKQSDVAMYTAKKDTVSGFSYFTEDMHARVRERLVLENRVKKAYQEECFYNQYQPIVNAELGKTVGVELLLRCSLSEPALNPSQFIPVLEELRYVIDVTRSAMKRAIIDLQHWYADGFDGYVAINLSALHFKMEFDVDGVIAMLNEAGLPRHALRFELTEGILMDDAEGALRQVNRFIEAGFVLALDDFGTGYSSLSYLKKFPLQVLKIDKSFVDDIAADRDDDPLILATIDMATSLNMCCVAEGVESREQVQYLMDKGCVYHQGYYYSRPVEAAMVPALLSKAW